VKMAQVWTFRDGKATTFRQHTDTARVRELS
jgi:ketosteroid isomerase-like protein